jgi:hypothetical protein
MVMRIRATLEIPDRSITRAKLEYPATNVNLSFISAIDRLLLVTRKPTGGVIHYLAPIILADAMMVDLPEYATADITGRLQDADYNYFALFDPPASSNDLKLFRRTPTAETIIASQAVDIGESQVLGISCSGSSIRARRWVARPAVVNPASLPAPTGSAVATDTTFASGYFGVGVFAMDSGGARLLPPATPLPPAQAIIEVEVEGSGAPEDPYSPLLSKNLVEITSLEGLPSFLYQEAKKYEILKNKDFTDDEIKLLLGYIPQHQIDRVSVTWGAFEFSKDSPTNVIIITGDNPYQQGAIQRHAELARSKNLKVLRPPRNYGEAVAQYQRLKRDYQYWLVGKDNYAYQVLGLEELDLFQNVDFYHGELIEHKAHYQQLRQVSDFEMWRRLEELERRLEKVEVLAEERDKHVAKIREVKRLGW